MLGDGRAPDNRVSVRGNVASCVSVAVTLAEVTLRLVFPRWSVIALWPLVFAYLFSARRQGRNEKDLDGRGGTRREVTVGIAADCLVVFYDTVARRCFFFREALHARAKLACATGQEHGPRIWIKRSGVDGGGGEGFCPLPSPAAA